MPGFFSRRRKPHPAPVGNWAVPPNFTAIPNSPHNKSFVEQKIHPDLNSLAAELALSQGHEFLDMTISQRNPNTELYDKGVDFVGLEPSTRRGRKQSGAHTRTQELEQVDMKLEYQQIGIPHLDPSSDTNQTEKFPHTESDKYNYNIRLPSAASPPSGSPTAPSPKKRWSIFGGSTRALHRNSDASTTTNSVSRFRSQSSLSQPHSRATSQGRMTLAEGSQPRTPKSQSSMYYSAHQSRSTPSYKDDLLPSPHTFGVPTPPQEPTSGSAHENSYFGFRETPPPLPPLDHPAFLQASKGHISPTSNTFPIQPIHSDVQEKFPRHFHSLPSLAYSGSSDTQFESTKGARKRDRRASSRSNIFEISSLRREHKTNKKQHDRNGSVASSIGARRSSAEYSAQKASSVGNKGKRDECWEVQVSKEMVRLALQETKNHTTSSLGKACGKNLVPGEAVGLGSPFLLQDTLTRNFRDTNHSSNEYPAISSPKLIYKSSNVIAKSLRAGTMSHGDDSTTSGNAGRKGKEKESGVPAHNSHSRRGGGRTSSTPSHNRSPSPSLNLDTSPFFGSIRGSSSLQPPALSVISPTPDVSPVSPPQRPHHKSQPTMPTSSVLRRPNTPPIIEQSYSNGSGKRKADEADFEGDKTPPKDSKEQRATFAPDPRTHRMSATSGLSAHAPSSFNRSKRVRLSQSFDARSGSRSNSYTGSFPTPDGSPANAQNTGSWSSRGSRDPKSATSHRAPSTSHHSHSQGHSQGQSHRPSSRRSLSQASIPISALVSPHAPSVGRSGAYHMRDPRKPPRVQSTTWGLAFPSQVQESESRWAWKGWVERGGSPLHAWIFFIGFILFPLWWVAAFIPVRQTRRLGGTDAEKGVVLDDPQLEHDAKSWRRRCRIMAGVSLITYIPFIALVAIFA